MNSLNELFHIGVKRRSGRYPWGSGKNPYQHTGDFISRVDDLRAQGFTWTDEKGRIWTGDTAIAKSMGLSTTQFRAQLSIANSERRALLVETAKSMRDRGMSPTEIAKEMGFNSESSVRSLLSEQHGEKMTQAKKTAEFLKQQVAEKGMIDVGAGVEKELNISREKLGEALAILQEEGYPVYGGGVAQVANPGKQTILKVLCPPGTEHKDIYNYKDINTVKEYTSHDDGETFDKLVYPKSMSSSRLKIRYAEDGGEAKDGVIELRRGVEDLSLGNSHYAQVRILVDDNKYLKGMAIYSDDLPDGVDVVFNTNKKRGTPTGEVLKDIKKDPDNPFGSLIKAGGQSYYIDKDGNRQLSLINKTREEGEWTKWKDKLPAQFLAKQSADLARRQLNLAVDDKISEYEEICSLTNPTVKKKLLKSFADDCDSAAVHLQAAALPRQKYQVILPLTSLSDNEVYAPNYKNGETLALVRFPHGGQFEIPILKVNNKNPEGRSAIGNALDAVGINKSVADRLSGADFDGDTVLAIPCNSSNSRVHIQNKPPLKDLEGFDTKKKYGYDSHTVDPDGKEHYYKDGTEFKPMKETQKQKQMGSVSNLITDMTIKGATDEEIARAVKHSMVVIDAVKHHLDYRKSEADNGIAALKRKYQGRIEDGRYTESASTLLSRASAEQSVLKRQGSPIIDPETGKQTYKVSEKLQYVDKKTGKTVTRTQKSTQMAETDDAYTLSTGTLIEDIYADYANRMKALANQSRKEMLSTGKIKYSASAAKTYKKEVDSLNSKLNVALKNAPRERQAQLYANSVVNAKKQDNPDMTKAEIKKAGQQALTAGRNKYGAQRNPVTITDSEWDAIQSGAITENKLSQILDHADLDTIRQRATPRSTSSLSPAKEAKLRNMNASGTYTIADIAEALGISTSTVRKYLSM